MKKAIGAAFVTALLAGAAYAAAPTSPTTPQAGTATPSAGASTSTTFVLAAADENKLKDWVATQKTASIAVPAGFNVAGGSTPPATITLYPIPARAGNAHP